MRLNLSKEILCPECLTGLYVAEARGLTAISHQSLKSSTYPSDCSRVGSITYEKSKGSGLQFLQVPYQSCPDCLRQYLNRQFLPDKLRVKFFHLYSSISIMAPDTRCHRELLLPIATFAVFI